MLAPSLAHYNSTMLAIKARYNETIQNDPQMAQAFRRHGLGLESTWKEIN